ncbi:TPA: abortive infection system antitoxin AbiGi family protein [Vibrio parahaemolyticus]|uniref:abortive infection system antitoxin AbiGi family protein n=1 Tax=Vibrio parahaemolyticus TaxID=670 RepID=UPI0011242FF7|nr:abortive infection system antitoxin AbiGi family protein [Vibrio parahaemolyticus]MBE3906713.1 hypothetical protein [Vibrio parahaemolyticus]TOJ61916.1 hypothetical protein CGI34_24680 [Vibrio parahaemolyticus]
MKPKSNNLFHFTKNLEVLKLILQNGIQPRYCKEDFRWFTPIDDDYVSYPMACFCDIPLSRVSAHTDFYGNYGIGLSREWGLRNGLSPVIYCPDNNYVVQLANMMVATNCFNEEYEKKSGYLATKLFSFIKPLEGNMVILGEIVEKDFYQESEWRFVPKLDDVLFEDEYESQIHERNKLVEEYALQFTPSDIRYIFVRSDNDIPVLVDFIYQCLGQYPHNDLKILMSRIVSLDTLKLDL